MTFKIGKVTLPIDPSEVKFKFSKDAKGVPLRTRLPLLLDLGPKTPPLALKGYIAETGKTADQLEINYLLPLKSMVWKPVAIYRLIADDDMVVNNFWEKYHDVSGGIGDMILTDDTGTKQKGKNSCKIEVPVGIYGVSGIRHTFTTYLNVLNNDFYSFWWNGKNTGTDVRFGFDFKTPGTGNWGMYKFVDNFAGFRRIVTRLDESFETQSGVIDWSQVSRVWFETYISYSFWNLDRICFGVGQLVDGPGTRYDGIYLLVDLEISESYRALNAFPYTMELWLQDDNY